VDVRITVSYPATDGSMPETVEVEWTGVDDSLDTDELTTVLGILLKAPTDRLKGTA
jgi:hypothetical protein